MTFQEFSYLTGILWLTCGLVHCIWYYAVHGLNNNQSWPQVSFGDFLWYSFLLIAGASGLVINIFYWLVCFDWDMLKRRIKLKLETPILPKSLRKKMGGY